MAVNKVVVNGEAIIDLSADTVTANKLAAGYTAHDKSGAVITGTMDAGGGEPVRAKDVNFIDYDGTVLHSYTVAEAAALTALPALPTHSGLICQGWNWSLDDIKAMGRGVEVGAMYITDDGKTRIYIHLEDGRTSPMLGCCPNGTVTVDWGDGTEPDTLTGTSTSTVKWTPTHEYSAAGDYVIKLSVDGSVGFAGSDSSNQYSYLLRYSSGADTRNRVYQNAMQKVEIGNGVTSIDSSAFYNCLSLSSITIPGSVTTIGDSVFYNCNSLSSIIIPGSVTTIGSRAFQYCYSLSSITIPDGVTTIGSSAFEACRSLSSITIPDGVTSIDSSAFYNCQSLSSITIPDGVTTIGDSVFYNCYSLSSIIIPGSVTTIGNSVFYNCRSLSSIIIPGSVTTIGDSVFYNCYGVRYYDFTRHTAVPTLSNTNAFNKISADCEIRVPAALADKWKAATNWSTYANHIVGVSA